jgi:hypothetical protein
MMRLIARLPRELIQVSAEIVKVLLILLAYVDVAQQEVISPAEALLYADLQVLVLFACSERIELINATLQRERTQE